MASTRGNTSDLLEVGRNMAHGYGKRLSKRERSKLAHYTATGEVASSAKRPRRGGGSMMLGLATDRLPRGRKKR